MNIEGEKQIVEQDVEKEESIVELKKRIRADMIVNYLMRNPTLVNGEAEWEKKYASKLEENIDLHLKHSNPQFLLNDIPIYKAFVEVSEEELYGKEEKAA